MKKVLGWILAALLLFSALPAAALAENAETVQTETTAKAEGQTGTIVNCKTRVNVRAKATTQSKILGKASKGETFPVKGRSGNWVKIDFNGVDGFVYKTYIRVKNEGTTTEGRTAMIVNCRIAVNVRAKATSKAKILGTAARGAIYDVLGIEGSWIRIEYMDGVGYVFKRYVKLSASEESIAGKTGTIQCNTHVNIRAKATKDSRLLGTAKNGETFTVKGKSGNWIQIDFNGKTGYVYKTYIKIG